MRILIGKQIIVTCIAIIVGFILMDTYMYYNFRSIERDYKIMVRDSTQFTGAVKDIRAELWLRNTNIRNYILTGDPKYQQASTNSQQMINYKIQELEARMTSPNESLTISAATEEQLASMEEVASSARQLADKADVLKEMVSKFQL